MTIPAILFLVALAYGPMLRRAVAERRADAVMAEPLPPAAPWASLPSPRSVELSRRIDATDTEAWLTSIRIDEDPALRAALAARFQTAPAGPFGSCLSECLQPAGAPYQQQEAA